MVRKSAKLAQKQSFAYDSGRVHDVESKWRSYWLENKTFRTEDPGPDDETFYCLDMFPYPSGEGLHVGHPVGFIASDVVSRFKRMKGFTVLHPMGWDAFGLPAERHAMKTGLHPSETVKRNSANYKRQMDLIGLSFDWDRELSTTDPSFYQFTQSMFLDLYEAWFNPETQKAQDISTLPIPEDVASSGPRAVQAYQDEFRLAYFDEAMVNFCPELGTVVANEEVMADGRTEQGYAVVRKMQRQVMMRISAFAERLIDGLEKLDWPESIKVMQRNWIGRSIGHRVTFATDAGHDVEVYTTRADTLPGATFIALAPENPLVELLVTPARREEVEAYVEAALQKSELARKQGNEKSGALTGSQAINPLTGQKVPIFVSAYVLNESGTGAVMGVPAHDIRDFEFAAMMDLPVIAVLAPEGEDHDEVAAGRKVWTGAARALPFDLNVYRELSLEGMNEAEFSKALCAHLVETGLANPSIQYRIRDWIFSRQRYWGEPIPLVHWEDGTVEPVAREALPLELPVLSEYRPRKDGQLPLARAEDWVRVSDSETGRVGRRETLTMPQWAGSCWYPLRYMDPNNSQKAVSAQLEKRWGAVDLYIGGAEHATLHLLYSRFWYLALSDLGRIKTIEPFTKLINQGMLLSFTFRNDRGVLIPTDEVEKRDDGQYYIAAASDHFDEETADQPLERVKAKMSKSLRNVVTPDQVVESWGADAYRVCLMFMGPVEQLREWEDSKAEASAKFLRRFWRFVTDDAETGIRETIPKDQEAPDLQRMVDETVLTIEDGIETLRLNTSIARIMKCLNEIGKQPVSRETLEALILIFSPFAPFMCEELWERCGNTTSLANGPWPHADLSAHAAMTKSAFVVTVNGKKRAELEVDTTADDETLKAAAKNALANADMDLDATRMIIVRDKETKTPKLINIIHKG